MKLGYARVSSTDQHLDIQRETLTRDGCERIFEERVSGKDTVARIELQALIKFAKPGDVVIVTKLDRLARSTIDMLTVITELGDRGIGFVSLAEPWANTETPSGKFFLTCMAGVAEFERGRIRERQVEGIARAKALGKYKGRKRAVTTEDILALKETMTPTEIAKKLGCGRATVYRAFDTLEEKRGAASAEASRPLSCSPGKSPTDEGSLTGWSKTIDPADVLTFNMDAFHEEQ